MADEIMAKDSGSVALFGNDLQNVFQTSRAGAGTTYWMDAWLRIQRGDRMMIWDLSSNYNSTGLDAVNTITRILDSNNNCIGYKFWVGQWESGSQVFNSTITVVMVKNTDFDTADTNCNSSSSPVSSGETLTVTYEFRESIGSWIPNMLPDTDSSEKYFLKYNEDGTGSSYGPNITWVQDSES